MHTAAEVAEQFRSTKRWVCNLAWTGQVAWTRGPNGVVLFTDEQLAALLAHRAMNPQTAAPSIAGTRRTARRTA